jgi:hypothetical protein
MFGVYQQQLNRVQLYKSTSSICKTQLAFSAPTEMRKQSSTDINLYHKQEHQPCTNLCQTTCNQPVPCIYQSCVNHSSTMTHQYVPTSSTIHLMYVPTHQLLVSTMYSTCTSTKSPHKFHHQNLICSSVIDLVFFITFLQTFINFNSKKLAFSSNFSLVSHA